MRGSDRRPDAPSENTPGVNDTWVITITRPIKNAPSEFYELHYRNL